MMDGWADLTAALDAARADIVARAPDVATAAEGEAYLLRVLASSLAEASLGHMLTDGGLTLTLPTRGGANPDYRMAATGVDPARRYRIEGRLNDSERVGIGLYSYRADGASLLAGYAAFTADNVDAQGRFTLDMAPDAVGPDAMVIASDARGLVVRTLHRAGGTPAHVTLAGNPPIADLSLAGGTSATALKQAGASLLRAVRQFLVWTRATSARPNWIGDPPAEIGDTVIGTPDVRYVLGYYLLEPGEWLQVTIPPGIDGYWMLQALNHWLEALPGAHVSDSGVTPEADGSVIVSIGTDAPADAPNRIDPCGRTRGVLLCRLPGDSTVPCPQAVLCAR